MHHDDITVSVKRKILLAISLCRVLIKMLQYKWVQYLYENKQWILIIVNVIKTEKVNIVFVTLQSNNHATVSCMLSEMFHLWEVMSTPENISDFGDFRILEFRTEDIQPV